MRVQYTKRLLLFCGFTVECFIWNYQYFYRLIPSVGNDCVGHRWIVRDSCSSSLYVNCLRCSERLISRKCVAVLLNWPRGRILLRSFEIVSDAVCELDYSCARHRRLPRCLKFFELFFAEHFRFSIFFLFCFERIFQKQMRRIRWNSTLYPFDWKSGRFFKFKFLNFLIIKKFLCIVTIW